MVALAVMISVALVCGSGLAAWVLWLRAMPRSLEVGALRAEVIEVRATLQTLKSAIAVRAAVRG